METSVKSVAPVVGAALVEQFSHGLRLTHGCPLLEPALPSFQSFQSSAGQ